MKIIQFIRLIISVVLLALISHTPLKAQQNIQFTQYIFNAISVNPAYAGYKEEWFLQATHRMQWAGVAGAPVTTQVSIDGVTQPETRNVGLGLQFTSDKLGAQTATSVYADYAYRLRLDDADTRRLSLGIGVGLTQYGLDASLLTPVNADDPALTESTIASYIPDLRVGVYYAGNNWYMGFSVMDLLSGDKSNMVFNWMNDTSLNVMRKRHYYLISGGLFNLSEYIKLRPGFMWKEDLKGPSLFDFSAMFIFGNKFWVGGSYRTGMNLWSKAYQSNQALTPLNSVNGIVQFVITDNLRIGYSYDYSLNDWGYYQKGSHEITLGYIFRKSARRVLSPRFF